MNYTLGDTVLDLLNKGGGAPAFEIKQEKICLSFKEARQFVDFVGHIIKQQQIPLIGIYSQKSPAAWLGVLSALGSNVPFVPLNPKLPRQALIEMVELFSTIGIITDSHNMALARANFPYMHIIEIQSHPFKVIHHQPLKLASGLDLGPALSEIAYLVFTSGSTGSPKGIQVTRANLSAYIENISKLSPLAEGMVMSQAYDLSFDPAIGEIILALIKRCKLVPFRTTDLIRAGAYFSENQIQYWSSAPSYANLVLQMAKRDSVPFGNLMISSFIGEALRTDFVKSWLQQFPNTGIENLYGPAEITISISQNWIPAPVQSLPDQLGIPIGKIYSDHLYKLEDENRKETTQLGELIISGPQVARGYLDSGMNKNRFAADAGGRIWYRTGDIVKKYEGGSLVYCGRKDAQMKVMGQRFEPEGLEAFARQRLDVNNAILIPLVREEYESIRELALVVDKQIIDKVKIQNFYDQLRLSYAEHLIPRAIYSLNKVPLNTSGKLDRKAIESMLLERQLTKIS